jgi:NAD(P)-dependent dehydrogenase (short-subunit alcohol dehydrogenase family)
LNAVVVTGASSGIGAGAVERLARQGFIVFAGVRSDGDAQRVAAVHENIRPLLLDVTDSAAITRAAGEVRASALRLIGVVANAGIALGGPLEYLPIDVLRKQFEVNVFGTLAVVQAFLPLLPEGAGRIVPVGSIAGRLPVPYIAPYSASKAALRFLSDALRFELAPAGIRVSLIEPGDVKTPIWKKGRESRDRVMEMLGPNPRAHYLAALQAVFQRTEIAERDGMPVDVVVDAIVHALTAPKPRSNYLLGTPAKLGSIVALMPASVRDRILRTSLQL